LKGVAAELKTINPATEEIINRYQIMTQEQINDKVKKARNTFHDWKKDAGKRTDLLHDFANELRNGKENLARTATTERGKVIKEARSEVEKCAWVIEYYADNGRILSTDEIVNTDARKTVIKFQPIGVIGSIMPWKIPYWQALRFAAPSLVIGNTIVLKSASATTQCGIEIEKSFNRAGLPEGVFQTLVGDSSIAGPLIDSDINAVTFTGSVPAGAKVAHKFIQIILCLFIFIWIRRCRYLLDHNYPIFEEIHHPIVFLYNLDRSSRFFFCIMHDNPH
jgi:acyl-CoA reductase-like NAD-dependent aldehyde dehydrogenase